MDVVTLRITDARLHAWIQSHTPEQVEDALRCGVEIQELRAQQVVRQWIHGEIKDQANIMRQELATSSQSVLIPIESQMGDLQRSLGQLHSNLQGSATKGRVGENLVQQNICQYFPEAELVDTSKEINLGDVHVVLPSGRIMVEVKTYATNVPTAQVEKFRTEFQAQSQCHTGLFVATTSGIVRKKQLEYELFDDGQRLAVFVSQAGPDGGHALIFAIHFCDLFMRHRKRETAACAEEENEGTIQQFGVFLVQQSDQLTRLQNLQTQHDRQRAILTKSLTAQRDISLQVGSCIEELLRSTLAHEFFPVQRAPALAPPPPSGQKRPAPDNNARPSVRARKGRNQSSPMVTLQSVDDGGVSLTEP